MPKYRVLERSYINSSLVEAGVEVDYDGEPGPNLEPLDPAPRKGKRVPKAVAELLSLARQRAAGQRGDDPGNVNGADVDAVAAESEGRFPESVVVEAKGMLSIAGDAQQNAS